jgi:hypothetical protein
MARAFDIEPVDPFAQITAPPADETPEQRRIRERREEEERKISEQIDEALKLEREEVRVKRRNRLKVLLLGQSESGERFVFVSRWCLSSPSVLLVAAVSIVDLGFCKCAVCENSQGFPDPCCRSVAIDHRRAVTSRLAVGVGRELDISIKSVLSLARATVLGGILTWIFTDFIRGSRQVDNRQE